MLFSNDSRQTPNKQQEIVVRHSQFSPGCLILEFLNMQYHPVYRFCEDVYSKKNLM